jgi:hypothetical protein
MGLSLHLRGISGILPFDALPLFIRQVFQVLLPPGTPADMPFPDSAQKGAGVLVVLASQFAFFTTGHFIPPCKPMSLTYGLMTAISF